MDREKIEFRVGDRVVYTGTDKHVNTQIPQYIAEIQQQGLKIVYLIKSCDPGKKVFRESDKYHVTGLYLRKL